MGGRGWREIRLPWNFRGTRRHCSERVYVVERGKMNGEERRQVGTGGFYVRHSEYRATLETSFPSSTSSAFATLLRLSYPRPYIRGYSAVGPPGLRRVLRGETLK